MAPKAGEALNVSPRPVFWEELDFLGLDKLGWTYPHSEAPLLWACNRQYFYRGELVLEVKGGNLFDKPITHPLISNLVLQEIDLNQLKQANDDSLFLLEHEAINFISNVFLAHVPDFTKKDNLNYEMLAERVTNSTKLKQTVIKEECGSLDIMEESKVDKLGKTKIYHSNIEEFIVSFSGGKDSQVVLDLVARVLPPERFRVIYSDTGYELPTSLALYDTIIQSYALTHPQIKFYTATNHKAVLDYWDELDSPSKIHRWCCAVMKTAPLYRLLKELHGTGKQPNVLAFEGVRGEESLTRSSYDRIGRGVKHNNVVNARPIFDWSTTEVWLYILTHNLPINPAYRKGLNRVGCVICPLSSELGDCLDYQFFKSKAQPFVDKLRLNAERAGIRSVDTYIKERKWKVRAGGNRHQSKTSLLINSENNDFVAILNYPKESFLEWLKILGSYQLNYISPNESNIELKFNGKIYSIKLTTENNRQILRVNDCNNDLIFISLLKKVLNKTTYCVHCEVCEIECPTGALQVVPNAKIDQTKCINCFRCLNFKDNGCVAANSVKVTQGIIQNNSSNMISIKKFNTFGFRKPWLKAYIDSPEDFFDETKTIVNVKKQLPIFINWMIGATLLSAKDKSQTTLATKILPLVDDNLFWEIVWVNLSVGTELGAWVSESLSFERSFSREELTILMQSSFESVPESSRDNALKAFLNTLKESPIGKIGGGIVSKVGAKPMVTRQPHNDLSLVAAAYSLYKYAEKNGRYQLTVSEFYNPEQKEGIVRQFGIEREVFETILRSLEQDRNQVLRSELKMGLDNIILREDLTSDDIIKLML